MVKESCYLIGKEAELVIPSQKKQYQTLYSLDSYIHAKNVGFQWIPSKDFYDPKNAILLVESILGHNWRTKFFQDMPLSKNHLEYCYAPVF